MYINNNPTKIRNNLIFSRVACQFTRSLRINIFDVIYKIFVVYIYFKMRITLKNV